MVFFGDYFKIMRKIIASLFALIVHCMPFIGFTQVTFPDNGPKDERANWYAFTNATIYKDYKTVLYNATLIIKNGQIQSVGVGLDVPAGAIVKDLKGAFIYPSFIDAYSDYGVATPERPQQRTRGAQNEMSNKKGAYGWNQAIKPEINAVELFVTDEKYAEQLRTLGFGSVVTHAQDGIARGTASAVLLGDKNENDMVIKDRVSSNFSFSKGSSSQNYPSSLMGSIALIRQTELDAAWYEKSSRTKEFNLSLEAWNNNKKLLQVFEVYNWQDVLRANKLGEEFGVQYVFKGTGDEYKRLNEIAKTNGKLIIPLNFPEAMDMEDPFTSENISLETLKHWEMAPANAKLIADANISFCITSSNLKDRKTFLANVRKAVENGLSQEAALKALTLSPAEMYNISDRVGTLEKGKIANFIVVSGDIFSTKNQILENWVKGEQYIVKAVVEHDLRGKYDLYFNSTNYKLDISGSKEKPDFALTKDSTKIKVSGAINDYYINLYFNEDKDKTDNFTRLSGVYDNNGIIKGSGNLPKGKEIQWIATKKEAFVEKPDTLKLEKKTPLVKVTLPFGTYGFAEVPKTKTVLIKNITVWTCEKEGILKTEKY